MLKKSILSVAIMAWSAVGLSAQVNTFETYKLDNGLTVYLWEDKNQPDVTGSVLFKAGAVDEPAEYSGLAHYLEHVLFKGTRKIGALDWEKEQPLYDEIIKKYDELAETTDEKQRAELEKAINALSIEAAKYAQTNEFSNLVEGFGGEGLNAGTSYDMTTYFNRFPAYQMEKWLDLYSERLIDPVFRSFQAELENVFEEFNMYQDNRNSHVGNFLFSNIYKGHPYERDIIGSAEHLKKPRLSKLIEFYNQWYVPENMALILVGNFDAAQAKPLIASKFGRLPAKKSPERASYPDLDFAKSTKVSAKLAYNPQLIWAFKGVHKGHPDEFALDFCVSLLTNDMQTGMLDKLSLDGDLQAAGAMLDARRDRGRVLVFAIPYYDINQRMYESDRATERHIMAVLDKIKTGNIEDWLIESVKAAKKRELLLIAETPRAKTSIITDIFVYGLPNDYFVTLGDQIDRISKEDIQKVARKYFDANSITLSIQEGTPKKNKLKKPDIKPIEQPKGQISDYAKYLQAIPVNPVPEAFNNLSDVQTATMYDGIRLHRTENKMNDLFSLTIKYGVGTTKMPKLEYAAPLMNSAGIMPDMDAQEVRKQFSQLNAQCEYSVSDDYFYIRLLGEEKNLKEICQLMMRQVLMPKLDDKQANRVKGYAFSSRRVENNNSETLADALMEYALYKNNSEYIDRLSLTNIFELSISNLTGEVIRATNYAADIHYVGKLPIDQVRSILAESLPLKEGVIPSESPLVRERISYEKPTIYFLHDKEAQQSKINFYIQGADYNIADDIGYMAFNQYFSGGFNGLVMQEIRENNSMAYTAYGAMSRPPLQNKKAYFIGYVGTQPDKAADAIALYMKLLQDMPLYPERLDNIKTYLRQSALSDKPSFRTKSQVFDAWAKRGYTDDPNKINMSAIQNLKFEQIVDFYHKNIKGKPVVIVITGDQKLIDLKKIESNFGKITKIGTSTLFSKE